ncbi:hypothetical protein [Nonomuraea soli]|uniref:Uncharacterized protein n=1 Tax=Nonomuraea soli TaxID=1032476 RepID=A0A7W0CML8_9ACTN|nr:hypothetical protein [Nonomuraea soli]MBA2893959.1 hypothetical protein [Nonomuraea soli]
MRRALFLLVTVLAISAAGVTAGRLGGIMGSVDIPDLDGLSVVLAGIFVTWVVSLAAGPERRPARVRERWGRLGRQ